MRKSIAVLLYTLVTFVSSAYATTLTGSLVGPNGVGINGRLSLSLAQQAALYNGTVGSVMCGGPAQIVPNQQILITITNGSLVSPPAVYGNDCLYPQGTYYIVQVTDNNGNLLLSDRWVLFGASIDVGTIVSLNVSGTTGSIGQNPFAGYATLAGTNVWTGTNTYNTNILGNTGVNIGTPVAPFASGYFSASVQTPIIHVTLGSLSSPTDFFGFVTPSTHTFNLDDSSGDIVLSYYNGGGLATANFVAFGNLLPNAANPYNIGASGSQWNEVYAVTGDFSGSVTIGGTIIGTHIQNVGTGDSPTFANTVATFFNCTASSSPAFVPSAVLLTMLPPSIPGGSAPLCFTQNLGTIEIAGNGVLAAQALLSNSSFISFAGAASNPHTTPAFVVVTSTSAGGQAEIWGDGNVQGQDASFNAYYVGGGTPLTPPAGTTPGVSCTGTPTSSFATLFGIVTHC